MRTIVIGLGNPALTDDGVGIKVARAMMNADAPVLPAGVVIEEAYAGGLRLMDAMVGYERAIIVDAMVSGDGAPGTVRRLCVSDLFATRNLACSHDTNLSTALETGKMLGLTLPSEIIIWGINVKDVETFGEELTADVAKAVPVVVKEIFKEIKKEVAI